MPGRVAVLGTGTMGAPMARALLRGGFEVTVWNRSPARAGTLAADGAHLAATPADAAHAADVLITMLSDGAAVEAVATGPEGMLASLSPDAVWIQMSTVGVESVDRLSELAAGAGVAFVDAPVSGSSGPAEAGELVVLASGADAVRDRVQPIFDVLGRSTVWLPRVGDGSRLKLALNNWLAVLVEGMAETLSLAAAFDIDPQCFLDVLGAGPMASEYAIGKGAAMLERAFTPGFPLRLAVKDAELAARGAHHYGLDLALTGALLPRWRAAVAEGHGEDDIAAVVTTAPTG